MWVKINYNGRMEQGVITVLWDLTGLIGKSFREGINY
jgi:hypothetical protein